MCEDVQDLLINSRRVYCKTPESYQRMTREAERLRFYGYQTAQVLMLPGRSPKVTNQLTLPQPKS